VARTGARPVFVDIEPRSFNISPAAIEKFIATRCDTRDGALVNRATGGRIRCIMPVHLYGQVADMTAVMQIARRHGLRVIEDAAQAIGSEDAQGRRAGSVGDIGCLSFFPTKNLGAFGDAGMCVTNDAALAAKMRILRVHGGEPKYYHSVIGGNFRLDEIQAAVLLVKLRHLDAWTAARQRNGAHYSRMLEAARLGARVRAPHVGQGRHIFNQYVIRAERRDELRARLSKNGVGTEIYYPVSLHEQQCFAYLGYRPLDLPNAHRAAGETLALPVYPELTEAQREYVVAQIAAFYRGL
jgi:dTDP-4-amino-4,6-dideoxygalactose transaminase